MTPYLPLLSVTVGAILATTGGFISGRLAAKVEQRRRARFAATIGREVLASLQHVVVLLNDVHDRGDPFGRLTMRLIRSARREVELYERNREAMFEVGDDELRFQLHDLMTRLAITLDFLIDESQDKESEVARHAVAMAEAFDVFQRHCADIAPMIGRLQRHI
ncbi:hypothetical protein [Sphingomonas sp. Leaf4]|uniref:hypothetical protein n=1 Tax=Sphingomonas sp. Leaf4 TaxID=2876553 RepID=UPI001E5600C4|nr:hypothetical protein [Sphingomonas sp. Leaf4]